MGSYDDTAIAQFENINSLRMYPFSESGSLVDRNGIELPKDTIVDLHMTVPCDLDSGFAQEPSSDDMQRSGINVMMSSVHMSSHMISVCFRSDAGGDVNALSVTVSSRDFMPYTPYMLEKLNGSTDIGGVVTFGDLAFPEHPYTYFLDRAIVHPCCISYSKPAMLRRFIDPRSGESISGDVDISFSGHVISSKDGGYLRLSLESGSELALASECAVGSVVNACGATPIRSINGVYPDSEGNIVLWFH